MPSSRRSISSTDDLHRVRDLLAGPAEHLLADQLGEVAPRWADREWSSGGYRYGPSGSSEASSLDQGVQALAGSGADREDLVDAVELGRRGERGT